MKDKILIILKWLVTGGLIYLVWDRMQNDILSQKEGFLSVFLGIDLYWLALSIPIILISFALSAVQWWLLLKRQGIPYGLKRAVNVYFVGLFFNNFMLGNAGGDAKKIYDVYKDSSSLAGGFSATIFDRIFGLFVINLFCLISGLIFFRNDSDMMVYLWPSLWIFVGMVLFFAGLFSRRLGSMVEWCIRKVLPESIGDKFHKLRSAFQAFRPGNLLVGILGISIVIQFTRILTNWMLGVAVGISLGLDYYLFFIPMIGIVSALPISIGGFGPREFLAQRLFGIAGIGVIPVLAMTFWTVIVGLFCSLIGGISFLIPSKKTPQKVSS